MRYILLLFFILNGCIGYEKSKDLVLEVHDYKGLENYLQMDNGKTYVVNFWATWCAPCIKELPYFEKLYSNYKDRNVELLLVSLDFPHHYETKLKPFIINNEIKGRVICLDDPNMNSWIPKVNEAWDGGIPATLIYKDSMRRFFNRSFTYNELENELKPFLN